MLIHLCLESASILGLFLAGAVPLAPKAAEIKFKTKTDGYVCTIFYYNIFLKNLFHV